MPLSRLMESLLRFQKGRFGMFRILLLASKMGRYIWSLWGGVIEYAYLVIAMGSRGSVPAKLASTETDDPCKEMQGVQESIQAAQRIAVVGGGAVGVELAADIKSFYPEKDVTIAHSREWFCRGLGRGCMSTCIRSCRIWISMSC